MNPFTSDRGLSFYYNNYIDKRRLSNKKKMLLREKQYELDAQFIKKYVKSGKLLDIGCSGGFFLKKLPKSFEKYGIDLDVEAINYANKNSKFKANLIGGDFLKQKYKNNYFDVITMRGTIEHLSNPEKYLKKITKILKPGGKLFIIATPNGSSIGAKIFKKHWTLYHPIQHLSHFSMNNLELFFKRYNLNQYSYEYPYIGTPYENFFKDLLAAIKVEEKKLSEYKEKYSLKKINIYEIRDEFPVIANSQIDGALSNIEYEVDLGLQDEYFINLTQALKDFTK